MLIWVSWFIVDFINNLVLAFIFKKLNNLNKKISFKDYLIIFLVSIVTSTIIVTFSPAIKLILKFLIMIFAYYLIFKETIAKTTITVLLLFISLVISEIVFSTVFIVILKLNQNFFQNNFFGIIIANLIITLTCYSFHKISKINSLEHFIIDWYKGKNIINIILLCILAEIAMYVLSYQNYIPIISNQRYLIINIFLVGVITFILGFFKEKSDNSKLLHDYDNLLEYSKEYEKEVIDKSKKQHEYKNQLVIIESMVSEKDKKVKDYINKLIDENSDNKDFHLIKTLSYIKSDGLKGLIYYKLKQMKRKKINATVNISEQLNDDSIWTVCNDNLQDISRCLGVYIDNAIEASEISNDKYFMIEVALDEENIIFSISNTFKENVDLAKIEKEGYSSKGKGRGFGLSLVKGIIDTNKYLNSEREICGKYYIQSLYIKRK